MVTWGAAVMSRPLDEPWLSLYLQPGDEETYETMAVRFRACGIRRTKAEEWHKGRWSDSKASVTLAGGYFTEMHTGRSRISLPEPFALTPGMLAAARRGRAVVGLLAPGVVPEIHSDDALAYAPLVDAAIEAGKLLSGLAAIRETPEPYGRRFGPAGAARVIR